MKNAAANTPPVARTSAGLREALFDELDGLRSGRTTPNKANATAKLADQIINTVRMELDVERHISRIGQQPVTPSGLRPPLQLGG